MVGEMVPRFKPMMIEPDGKMVQATVDIKQGVLHHFNEQSVSLRTKSCKPLP